MVLTQFMARYTPLCDKICQWLVTGLCFTPVLRFPPPQYNWNSVESGNKLHKSKPKDDVRQTQDYNFLFYRFDWKLRWQSKTEVVPDCYMYLLEVKIIVRNKRLNLFLRQNSFGLSEDLPGELCIVNVTAYS